MTPQRGSHMSQDLEIDDRLTIHPALVRRLIDAQFPQWAKLPVSQVENDGWDNSTFRLGDALKVRLPTASRYVAQVEKEHRWLPFLAKSLPIAIPEPLAIGAATSEYPYPWSVYKWIDGEPASVANIVDLDAFAADLASFLIKLQRIPTLDGPGAGVQSFYRGGPLRTYDADTRQCLKDLSGEVNVQAASAAWEEALASQWTSPGVWVHGDIAAGNLLVAEGKLSAVIDFGCCAVGDPACDLVIAWTFFKDQSRAAFRSAIQLDDATWKRARGWALWKALITMRARKSTSLAEAQRLVADLLS